MHFCGDIRCRRAKCSGGNKGSGPNCFRGERKADCESMNGSRSMRGHQKVFLPEPGGDLFVRTGMYLGGKALQASAVEEGPLQNIQA